ncbi:MAG: hypothetical protein ACLTKG_07480 [Collinsella intestinalis]
MCLTCAASPAHSGVTSGEQFHEQAQSRDLPARSMLGLPASACCIEDSVPGITAGKAAGLTVVAKREERFGFSQDAADVIIDSIPDILEL